MADKDRSNRGKRVDCHPGNGDFALGQRPKSSQREVCESTEGDFARGQHAPIIKRTACRPAERSFALGQSHENSADACDRGWALGQRNTKIPDH